MDVYIQYIISLHRKKKMKEKKMEDQKSSPASQGA